MHDAHHRKCMAVGPSPVCTACLRRIWPLIICWGEYIRWDHPGGSKNRRAKWGYPTRLRNARNSASCHQILVRSSLCDRRISRKLAGHVKTLRHDRVGCEQETRFMHNCSHHCARSETYASKRLDHAFRSHPRAIKGLDRALPMLIMG
jgi:hypothetical protein